MIDLNRSISQPRQSRAFGRAIMLFFFFFFFLLGAGTFYLAFLEPMQEMLDSLDWPGTTCQVVSSQVKSHEDSDGITYSIDIEYSYRVGGKEYRSRRYTPTNDTSSGYKGKKAVVDRYPPGTFFTCYYDPRDPSRAVIKPGFSWIILFGLIPLLFALIGLGGMTTVLRRSKSTPFSKTTNFQSSRSEDTLPPRSYQDTPSPPSGDRVLEPAVTSSAKLGCAVVGALVLTGILAVIYSDELQSGQLTFWMLLNPFVLLDAALIGIGLPYFYLATFNPKPVLTLSPGRPRLGQDFSIAWRFSGNTNRLERLSLTLVGTEEAKYSRGTDTITDRSVFFQQVLKEISLRPEFVSGTVRARVPADSMHSWPLWESPIATLKEAIHNRHRFAELAQQKKLIHNRIIWKLELHGKISMWPDVKESFEFTVYPAPPREGRSLFEDI